MSKLETRSTKAERLIPATPVLSLPRVAGFTNAQRRPRG